ncbi:MAG: lyase family protein [Thermomicrobiales bacterium]
MTHLDDALAARSWEAIARIAAAHVSMLADVGVLESGGHASLMSALDGVGRGAAPASRLADLVAAFDERTEGLSPPGIVGAASVGRGAAEVVAAVIRLILRDDLLAVGAGLHRPRSSLLDLAGVHAVTTMPAYSGGDAAQPTTFGHFLGGLIGPLGRAAGQLPRVYAMVDRSPLGAGTLASTAIEIDRERQAELLGFSSLLDNTFDAVAAVDHLVACANLAETVATGIGRFLSELIAWLRIEPGAMLLSGDWTGHEPGLPQLTPATGIIELQEMVADVVVGADAVRRLAADAPYAPITGLADRALGLTSRCLTEVAALAQRTASLLTTGLTINRALLANRAGKGFSTVSDLGDFLTIEEGLEPAAARAIAALTYRRAADEGLEASGITPEMIDGAALMVLGREVGVEFEAISRYLAPRRFIERRTVIGGPAPRALRDYLDRERERLLADERWVAETRQMIDDVFQRLDGPL